MDPVIGSGSFLCAAVFDCVCWSKKLLHLRDIALGLSKIHEKSIIHRDFHSGNILINKNKYDDKYDDIKIGDLGLSKSATEADDNDTYGIIPYMAPEALQGQKYTTASDIYSFGMIMWECMTGRRPFWDRAHDTELIIDICDGLRPPTGDIVAPEGYIELMKECWDSDPNKRPATGNIYNISTGSTYSVYNLTKVKPRVC
ncbi:1363_t:CDS:2 [Funneliformis geosporum]|uniref:1363_t:CDS:1 n=1 Tax=Funneliformis geosporum TaxID=1117311 RepID=A0A9W4WMV8_9GLOM|nr:1363_t:CDS:2 [Funneliformis geosporum]